MRGMLVATAVLALTIGACKKKPKEDKAKDGDKTMDVMKQASMDAMKPDMQADAMKPGMQADAMKPGMQADAMKPAVAQGDGFIIKFDRPLKAGLKYKVVATGSVDSVTTLDGKPIAAQTVKMTYAYEAVVTVKAVHACGKVTQEEVKIVKLQVTKGGATKDLLPADTVVFAKAEGDEEKFTVKGKPVAKDVAEVLGYVILLYDGDATTTDDMFGPGGPKKPGDSWKPNVPKLLASLKTKFKKVALWPKPADVTGKVTFVAAKKVNGMDVFEIKVHARLNNIAPKMGPVKAKAGYLEMDISGWLPKDPKIIIGEDKTVTMKMHVEGEMVKGGKTHKIVVDHVQSQKGSKTPVK
jgi:hypothetical protein